MSYEYYDCPFTIVVDSNEGAPFHFSNLHTTSKGKNAPLIADRKTSDSVPIAVNTVKRALWVKKLGDYCIEGHENGIQIEAKHSLGDLVASFKDRRANFKEEIYNLHHHCDFAAVVICGTLADIRQHKYESKMEPAAVQNSILSWGMEFPKVHWLMFPSRFECEVVTFQLMEIWYRKFRKP